MNPFTFLTTTFLPPAAPGAQYNAMLATLQAILGAIVLLWLLGMVVAVARRAGRAKAQRIEALRFEIGRHR